jgi:gag-polypeptide of LTR copia-type
VTQKPFGWLCTHYEGTGVQAILYLMGKIWCKQFNDSSDLETQINELCAHALKCANLGFALPNNILAIAILLSLPPSYGTLQTSIGVTADDKINSHKFVTLILAKQQRHQETGEAAFWAHAVKSQNGKDNKDRKKGKRCTNCQRNGHTIKKCYLKGGGMEGQGPPKQEEKKDEKAKVVNETSTMSTSNAGSNSSKPIELFMATVGGECDSANDKHIELHVMNKLTSPKHLQTWIPDSGASAHMSSQHDWFTTHQEIHPP